MRQTSLWGKRRLASSPITSEASFRMFKAHRSSLRFNERPQKAAFVQTITNCCEAITDAPEVFELLKRIQKDAV
ncbi:hypothetical protein [Paracoccus albus]|uniref:hypothetical protein n=1 Tax=Paracoccus albus TaxID=3017784 RepID=UPI0022F07B90|nr:hypothetical protein [Paracoccus albus]WBU60513.1 hypothetical protein PAF20_00880 [Paracoccus albus]